MTHKYLTVKILRDRLIKSPLKPSLDFDEQAFGFIENEDGLIDNESTEDF